MLSTKAWFTSMVLAIGGCTTPKAPETFAKIQGDQEHNHPIVIGLDHRIYITSVDEWATPHFPFEGSEIVFVPPGIHQIHPTFEHINGSAEGCVWIDAQARGSYLIKYRAEGYRIYFYIVDTKTGDIVGGHCESQPAPSKPDSQRPIH